MFRARDAVEQQPEIHYTGDDPVMLRQKQELERQREQAVQEALGPEDYAIYKIYQDPVFQQSQATAQELGASAAMVIPIYQINQATEAERLRIQNDATLSPGEKIEALAAARAEQQKSLQRLLGFDTSQNSSPANE